MKEISFHLESSIFFEHLHLVSSISDQHKTGPDHPFFRHTFLSEVTTTAIMQILLAIF